MLTETSQKFVDDAYYLIQQTIDLGNSPLPEQLVTQLEEDSQICECTHRWLDALGPCGISQISNEAPGGAFDKLVDIINNYMQNTHGYRTKTVMKMYGKLE